MLHWVAYILSAFGLSVLMTYVLRGPASMVGLVDHPDFRKHHDGAIPLCGGVAVFLAFLIVNLAAGAVDRAHLNMWLGLNIVIAIGVVDDRIGLSAAKRLAAQFLVAFIMVDADIINAPAFLGSNISALLFGAALPVAYAVAILFIVGLTNSVNMLDGVDGLAGGCAAVALFWLAILSTVFDAPDISFYAATLFAAVCGFLVFNMRGPWRSHAAVFLGDAGSTSLGAVIAALMIGFSCSKAGVPLPVLSWIVIVPVIDTLSLIVRRLRMGRSPVTADRMHLHHLLLERTGSAPRTTCIIIAASALCGGIGCLGIALEIPDALMTLALLVPAALHTIFIMKASGAAPAAAHPDEQTDVAPTSVPLMFGRTTANPVVSSGHPPWRQDAPVRHHE